MTDDEYVSRWVAGMIASGRQPTDQAVANVRKSIHKWKLVADMTRDISARVRLGRKPKEGER